jgi:phage FluMu gp28-like protein
LVAQPSQSIIHLHPWQERFFRDRSRVKLGIFHRQAGKDFVAAAEAVDDALSTGADWFIVSITQRQADATFAKARTIANAYKRVAKAVGEVTLTERQYEEFDSTIDQHFRCTARTIHLPGGGSVTALPGRDPDTLAGLTGNVIFTEFGLFPRGGYDHWRVVFPLITRGFRIIVISTPRGKNTKFYELASDRETYSVHIQTIEDSVREGFRLKDNAGRPCSVDEFRQLYRDESGWAREYMCEFTGDLSSLIRWALLEQAAALSAAGPGCSVLRVEAEAGWRPGWFAPLSVFGGRLEIGWDVARTSDLSAVWCNLHDQAKYGTRRHLVALALMHNTPFAVQREVVREAMRISAASVGCGDATGLGADSNETLANEFGERWQPVVFTASAKRELASGLLTRFEDGGQAIPPLDSPGKCVATDLYAIQADRTGANLVLAESANPLLPDSHCDIAWSGALARRASSNVAVIPRITVF